MLYVRMMEQKFLNTLMGDVDEPGNPVHLKLVTPCYYKMFPQSLLYLSTNIFILV